MKFPILILVFCSLAPRAAATVNLTSSYGATLNEVLTFVQKENPREQLAGVTKGSSQFIAASRNSEEFSERLRAALREAGGTHVRLLSPVEPAYWFAKAPDEKVALTGALFARRGKHWYITHAFPGSPAAAAGLKRGDELLTLAGLAFNPENLMPAGAGETALVQLEVKHRPWDKPQLVQLGFVKKNWRQFLHEATQRSFLVFNNQKPPVAYLRLWTMDPLTKTVHKQLTTLQKDNVHLILDLRGGVNRGEEPPATLLNWRGEVTVLVNADTYGSHEVLAKHLVEKKQANLLGPATAGFSTPFLSQALSSGPWVVQIPAAGAKPLPLVGKGRDSFIFADGHDDLLEEALKLAGVLLAVQ